MTSSDKSQDQSPQYVGVVDGVRYRMDARANGAWAFLKIDPQEPPPPPPSPPQTAPSQTVAKRRSFDRRPKPVPIVPPTADDNQPGAAAVFRRDGAEPLRAGHPDLWNLLVAGTCLEGSPYQP